MKNKKIIVTGSTGYIGGTFSYEALKKGFEVIGIDNFSNSKKATKQILDNFINFTFYEIDISKNPRRINEIISENKPDVIIHFAGLKSVSESEQNQNLYWQNNLLSTLNILESIKNNNISLIFSSSATVYGDKNESPIPEEAKFSTNSAYGSTKLAQELLISDYSRAYDISCISLRYFNPVGTHSDRLIIEDIMSSPNNLMPRILRVAKKIDKKISIYGKSYPTKDGTGERDYIHITDLVNGHFAALEKISSLHNHNFYNLGTGEKTSVLELIKTFENVNNIKIKFDFQNERKGDVAVCYADPSLAKKDLDWTATKTIDEMCIDAWGGVKDED
tara:strand:- start:297 stop:1295 length:999 start_codon:yes stop_codon:yes gene_type:complete